MAKVVVGGGSTVRREGTWRPQGTYAGTFDPTAGLPTIGTGRQGSILKGDYWKASAAGTIANVEPSDKFRDGDLLIAIVNNADAASEFVSVYRGFSIQSVASASTVTANANTDDQVNITAQAAALTLANPTGSPYDGQMIIFRIKDNGTARGITFGADFRALGVTLPTTTVLSKTLYLPCVWNAADIKWDVVGVIQQ